MKISVQAVKRDHFSGYWTPHRFWPSAEARIVEVIDEDEDPTIEIDEKGADGRPTGASKRVVDPQRIGKKTLAQVKASRGHLIVEAADDDAPLGSLSSAPPSADEMRSALASMKALERKVQDLEHENRRLRERDKGARVPAAPPPAGK